jgi:hypothetical protein
MPVLHTLLAIAMICLASLPTPLRAEDRVPLERVAGGLLAVRVELAGESLLLMLDTGATRTMVRAEVAERLHLKPRARFALETTVGTTEGLCAGPLAVTVGATELRVDCLGWSAALDETVLGRGIDGILAADALTLHPITLDLARRTLHLDVAPGADGHEVPLTLEDGRPTLTLSSGGGGRTLRLVVDSAAEDLVLFGRAAAAMAPGRRVGLQTLAGSATPHLGSAPRLGEVKRQPRRAVLLPGLTGRGEDGLLPLGALGTVTFDWQRGIAILDAT